MLKRNKQKAYTFLFYLRCCFNIFQFIKKESRGGVEGKRRRWRGEEDPLS